MSGREPVAAFFPSIDRNLMAELDRHLRSPQVSEPPPEVPQPGRPHIEDVVEAVEQAGSSIAAMTAHIQALESRIATLETVNRELGQQLVQSTQRQHAAEDSTRAHLARAQDCERLAAAHISRADGLETDLATALADLNRVTDAIANALGLP